MSWDPWQRFHNQLVVGSPPNFDGKWRPRHMFIIQLHDDLVISWSRWCEKHSPCTVLVVCYGWSFLGVRPFYFDGQYARILDRCDDIECRGEHAKELGTRIQSLDDSLGCVVLLHSTAVWSIRDLNPIRLDANLVIACDSRCVSTVILAGSIRSHLARHIAI